MILAGVLLGIVNSIVRPIAVLLTLPMTILTLGLVSFTGSWFVGGKGKVEVIVKRR